MFLGSGRIELKWFKLVPLIHILLIIGVSNNIVAETDPCTNGKILLLKGHKSDDPKSEFPGFSGETALIDNAYDLFKAAVPKACLCQPVGVAYHADLTSKSSEIVWKNIENAECKKIIIIHFDHRQKNVGEHPVIYADITEKNGSKNGPKYKAALAMAGALKIGSHTTLVASHTTTGREEKKAVFEEPGDPEDIPIYMIELGKIKGPLTEKRFNKDCKGNDCPKKDIEKFVKKTVPCEGANCDKDPVINKKGAKQEVPTGGKTACPSVTNAPCYDEENKPCKAGDANCYLSTMPCTDKDYICHTEKGLPCIGPSTSCLKGGAPCQATDVICHTNDGIECTAADITKGINCYRGDRLPCKKGDVNCVSVTGGEAVDCKKGEPCDNYIKHPCKEPNVKNCERTWPCTNLSDNCIDKKGQPCVGENVGCYTKPCWETGTCFGETGDPCHPESRGEKCFSLGVPCKDVPNAINCVKGIGGLPEDVASCKKVCAANYPKSNRLKNICEKECEDIGLSPCTAGDDCYARPCREADWACINPSTSKPCDAGANCFLAGKECVEAEDTTRCATLSGVPCATKHTVDGEKCYQKPFYDSPPQIIPLLEAGKTIHLYLDNSGSMYQYINADKKVEHFRCGASDLAENDQKKPYMYESVCNYVKNNFKVTDESSCRVFPYPEPDKGSIFDASDRLIPVKKINTEYCAKDGKAIDAATPLFLFYAHIQKSAQVHSNFKLAMIITDGMPQTYHKYDHNSYNLSLLDDKASKEEFIKKQTKLFFEKLQATETFDKLYFLLVDRVDASAKKGIESNKTFSDWVREAAKPYDKIVVKLVDCKDLSKKDLPKIVE